MSYVSTGLHRAVTIQRLTGSRNNAMSYVNIASRIIRSSPLFDRSELVCRRWGGKKFLAGTHPQACVSSRKFGEKTAKLHRLRELPSRGPSALVLYTQKHTQNAKINLSPFLKGDRYTSSRTLDQRRLRTMGGWEG